MFDFFSVPRIVFGVGKASALPELVGPLGPRVLVVYNGGEAVLGRITDALKGREIRLVPHRQKGEPTVADVDMGLDVARREACTGVIGAGGGSAIDAAKAIAGLLANGGSALDYMEVIGRGQKITQPAVPWIAVPTTAGTGAEATRNAVIGEPSRKFKASLRSELLLPRVAVVDPALGVDTSPTVTAWSGMDALCQCMEAYTSSGANALTDGLSLKGVELAARSLRRAVADGRDIAARSDMAMAALLSGIALTNAGLGAVHGFAAPIGANFPAPHGLVCAALLPHVIRANIESAGQAGNEQVVDRYATLGRLVVGDPTLSQSDAQQAAVAGTRQLAIDLQIPPLRKFGLADSSVADMVDLAKKASSMKFNPVKLADEVLADVLTRAIG